MNDALAKRDLDALAKRTATLEKSAATLVDAIAEIREAVEKFEKAISMTPTWRTR
jgi:hypothetical protein